MNNTKYTSPGLGGARDLRSADEKQRDHAQIEHDLWHVNIDNDCKFCRREQEQDRFAQVWGEVREFVRSLPKRTTK